MAHVRYEVNHRGIEELYASRELVDHLRDVAKDGVKFAKRIAPDRPPIGKGYVRGLRAVAGVEFGRALSRVISTDFKSHWIEFGTGGDTPTPKFRVLGKTLDYLASRDG